MRCDFGAQNAVAAGVLPVAHGTVAPPPDSLAGLMEGRFEHPLKKSGYR